MAITVHRLDVDRWEATDDGFAAVPTLRAVRRPDARRQLIVDAGAGAGAGAAAPRDMVIALLRAVAAVVPGELVLQVDEDDDDQLLVAKAADFVAARTDLTVEIAVDGARLAGLHHLADRADIVLIGAADSDLVRLRALDEEIRRNIPGSAGWVWSPEDFAWETFNPDFDPATYRIAVEPSSGDYLGLVRVWMKPDGPAFGCLGVRRDRRGTRVVASLVADVGAELVRRGCRTVRAEIDAGNRASLGVAERFGVEVIKRRIEYVRPAAPAA